jgi:hypothetical protein
VSEAIRTSDGELLSVKLKKVESRRRTTAFLIVTPLLIIYFCLYISNFSNADRSVDNTEMNQPIIKNSMK